MPSSVLFTKLTDSVAPFAGDAPILAAPFLDTCRLVLPVIGSWRRGAKAPRAPLTELRLSDLCRLAGHRLPPRPS